MGGMQTEKWPAGGLITQSTELNTLTGLTLKSVAGNTYSSCAGQTHLYARNAGLFLRRKPTAAID